MDYKTKIDAILDQRKKYLSVIEDDERKLLEIRKSISNVKSGLASLGKDSGIKNFNAELDAANENLNKIDKKISNMKKRFSRDTVNIGVSGEARVGKSTFLQTLTGLGDEQIPSGSGNPVTAVRSRIYNISGGSSYALVEFLDENEFIERNVKSYAKILGLAADALDSIDKLLSYDIPENFSETVEAQLEKNKALEKLRKLRENSAAWRPLVGEDQKPLNDLSELKDYVSYIGSGKYAAVKSVSIYCNFPSLDGAAVEVVDLPGFGEIGDVDEIQIAGLENDVDHVLRILRPEETNSFVGKNYASISSTLAEIQKDITDRGGLFSVLINEPAGTKAELSKSLKSDILATDATVKESENLYEADAKNAESVGKLFVEILSKMIPFLKKADGELVASYKNGLGLDELKSGLERLLEQVRDELGSKPTAGATILKKSQILLKKINTELKNLDIDDDSYKDEFIKKTRGVKDTILNKISDNLMFSPTEEYPSWEKYWEYNAISSENEAYTRECSRIRIAILKEYNELNEFYKEKMEEEKEKIVSVFREQTGTFADKNKKGTEAVKEILAKLEKSGQKIEGFVAAFKFLEKAELNFEQNIYPAIFGSSERDKLNPDKTPIPNELEKIEEKKAFLSANAKYFNNSICSAVIENNVSIEYIKCVLENFNDLLIRYDYDKAAEDFYTFVEIFQDYLGEDSNKLYKRRLIDLKDSLQKSINLIADFEKEEN